LLDQFKTTKIDSDRQKYMAALSATEDPTTLRNLLNMTIHREESGIRLQVKRFISGNVLLWPQFFSLAEEKLFLTFPAYFYIPIIFSNLNSNCSNLLNLRNLQEQVKKTFCNQKLF
jgi:hypothetical protein